MQIQLHRGRLIDHIHLVVSDLEASRAFYTAILAVLDIPVMGTANDHFWADELFISSVKSPAAQAYSLGVIISPFKLKIVKWSMLSILQHWRMVVDAMANLMNVLIILIIIQLMCLILMATILKLSFMAKHNAAQHQS